ncbi:hypothetical protein HFP15_37455 [Amycolatopsis sp. K13G38]|uniref:YbjN domain-containing protein n=1 Tax=Amycolatopsis acididurans TaxID=2724524 RepID=A0ABX1JGP0_9PSEU|nr:hypothetical protein [Amycolatopsis acididurans]NKQ58549.1 hypothetical protein [Amycolatopsis acididurans]
MATWRDLVAFVRHGYEVIRFEPDEVRVRVRVHFAAVDVDDDERVQTVVLAREVLDRREEWVQIATPFARVGQVDLQAVLEEVGATTVVGGVVIMGDYLVLRHSLPLIHLDLNEFTDPVELVATAADDLEQRFTGHDDY